MPMTRRFACAGLALLSLPSVLRAQPAGKTVRVVVPLPAGGVTDVIARLYAEKLQPRLAAPVIVDNRVGAGGRVGVESVRNGEADGSLLLFTPDFPLTLYPHIYRKMSYQLRDLAPIAPCGITSFAVVAGPMVPDAVKSLPDFVRWCQAHPKDATYASPAAGSTPHFVGMMISRASGVPLLHVPFKGGALAVQAVIGGQVPVCVVPVGEALQHIKAGRLRAIATTGTTRSKYLPEVAAATEAYKDVVVQSWIGFLAPAAVPGSAIDRLNREINDIMQSPDLQGALGKFGFDAPPIVTASGFLASARADLAKWGDVVKAAGFTSEED